MFRALEEACDSRAHFEIEWIVARAAQYGRTDTKPFVAPAPLTGEAKARADLAAVKSLLYLHYRHGWDLATIGNHTLGRAFAASRGLDPKDAHAALAAAKEAYPQEVILRWMDAQ